MRTGPLGRLARLGLAAIGIASFISIADQGGPLSFRGARNLAEPSLLLLDAVLVVLFVSLVSVLVESFGAPRWARRSSILALIALVAAVAIAAASSQLAHGTVWDRPLSDVVWWFDALMLIETIAALLLVIAIGLPGCEIGVWPYLIARARGERPSIRPVGCVVGLHLLDDWEASRRSGPRNSTR